MGSASNSMRLLDSMRRATMHNINPQPGRNQHRPLLHHTSRNEIHTASQRQAHGCNDRMRMATRRRNLYTASIRLGTSLEQTL